MIEKTKIFVVLLILWISPNVNCADRTFPGAEIIIPAVIPIIGSILPSLIPGFPGGGGGIRPPGVIGLPAASISHSTSFGTTFHNKPIAISHSGSISTSPSNGATSSWGSASSSSGNHHVTVESGSTSNGPNPFKNPLNRWRRILFNNIKRRG